MLLYKDKYFQLTKRLGLTTMKCIIFKPLTILMEATTIPFKETGYSSKLICDYLDDKSELRPFYNRYPNIENFKYQIEEKSKNYPLNHRKVLVESLKGQYGKMSASELTLSNIDLLLDSKTFTVVTGHQLNLFTGPLYFLYKIVSTINLTKKLKETYPENEFVPVYWMATEDHDFEEINYFNFKGRKVQWNQDQKGAVGRLAFDIGLACTFMTKLVTSRFRAFEKMPPKVG